TTETIPFDCGGPITSLGNNIIGTISGCTINLQGTDFVGDPGLDNFAGTFYPLLPMRNPDERGGAAGFVKHGNTMKIRSPRHSSRRKQRDINTPEIRVADRF